MGRRRFSVADHPGVEELAARYRAARDPVERGRWRMIRLLVAGRSLAEVADVTGYGTRWVREVVRRYNAQGPAGLADRRHANPGAAPLLDAAGRVALAQAFQKLDPLALGLSLGTTAGVLLFVATLFLVAKGGEPLGPTLGLLGQYFPGYGVTASGSLLGLLYGFLGGFAGGWGFAVLRNAAVLLLTGSAERRAERDLVQRLLLAI